MNIYFFSHHTPEPKMLEELGGEIAAQFKGTISDIHRTGDRISFTEHLFIGGQDLKCCHTIPTESIVVLDGSLLLQDAWLKAGVATLLVPQINQKMDDRGKVLFKYCELLQIHRIEVVTSQWSSTTPTRGDRVNKEIA